MEPSKNPLLEEILRKALAAIAAHPELGEDMAARLEPLFLASEVPSDEDMAAAFSEDTLSTP